MFSCSENARITSKSPAPMEHGLVLRLAKFLNRRNIGRFILLFFLCATIPNLQAQRQTVFVLVDESQSLKADRAGWRKDAAALLAYSLSDGRSMSLSGFGDPGRKLDITPLPLDSTELGIQRRNSLANTAGSLKVSDNKTDLFGAIHDVLVEASKMDPLLRHSAPPVLVILSDFRTVPVRSSSEQQVLCEELQKSHVDLIEVGFGKVDFPTSNYLANCAGTSRWGVVSDPAALPEVFWKLQNRFTKSLKIFEGEFAGPRDVPIPIPEWADEVLLLGLNERDGETTSTWDWAGDNLKQMQVNPGGRYRLARVQVVRGAGVKAPTIIHVSKSPGVKLSAVARGQLVLRIKTEPPSPW